MALVIELLACGIAVSVVVAIACGHCLRACRVWGSRQPQIYR